MITTIFEHRIADIQHNGKKSCAVTPLISSSSSSPPSWSTNACFFLFHFSNIKSKEESTLSVILLDTTYCFQIKQSWCHSNRLILYFLVVIINMSRRVSRSRDEKIGEYFSHVDCHGLPIISFCVHPKTHNSLTNLRVLVFSILSVCLSDRLRC